MCLGKWVIFVFGVFRVLERPHFREQKEVVFVVFFTVKGKVVLRVVFSYFLCFPTCVSPSAARNEDHEG